MYLNTGRINHETNFPPEADLEISEDDTAQAQKMDVWKVGSTYTTRDVFYFDINFGEGGIANVKDDEILEVLRIYFPKSLQ